MSKKRRKFRAMTYREFCHSFEKGCLQCPFKSVGCGYVADKPCKPNGKYILVEAKE